MASAASWVAGANAPEAPFPLDNLPYGVVSTAGAGPRCATAIGDSALDLAALEDAGLIPAVGFAEPALNTFMATGPDTWAEIRARLRELLAEGAERPAAAGALIPLGDVRMHMPFRVAGFTDFYAGRRHATNAGTILRGPENALPPNWLHLPIAYNGRASTVVVSGTDIRRPLGQTRPPGAEAPGFGPSRRLDFELEMGAVVGQPSAMGRPLSVAEADAALFGFVLLNDWSARDIQAWEAQPLGPFQGKAFATSISPWVVTKAALEPFRRPAPARDVALLPYLAEPGPMHYAIELAVTMAAAGGEPATIARTNTGELYYSFAQALAHHTSCGCRMEVGDLLGSGTISGPDRDAFGSLLEITWGGSEPLTLPDGARRTFLEDGDRLVIDGHAQGERGRIGFGSCAGRILPAPQPPR